MKESTTYQQQFRHALVLAMKRYMAAYPNLEQTYSSEYEVVTSVAKYANNQKYTPMIIWGAVNVLEQNLPRPFYFFFRNRLADILKSILNKYPLEKLTIYFTQEQFEVAQRREDSHSTEVMRLKTQAKVFEAQVTQVTTRLESLRQENDDLRKQNAALDEENLKLKAQLEQVLSKSGDNQQIAESLGQNLTQEIKALRDADKTHQQSITDLARDNEKLAKQVDQLTKENESLKSNNRRLSEINKKLLKEKTDLSRVNIVQSGSFNIQEPEVETKSGFGFFRRS